MSYRSVLAILGASFALPSVAHAHFVLQSPPAMTEQNGLGDPQKMPPCGDDGSAVATGIVTTYQAGETITISIDETIYHPGHYRVALAVNDPSELPDPPPVTPDNDSPCGTAPIDPAPVFPVLADGVLEHAAPFGEAQTIQVTLPDDISCTGCTLQVIQFMTDHGLNDPGGCYYHHCATIAIEGAASEDTTAGGNGPSQTDDGMTTMPPGDSSDGGTPSTDGNDTNPPADDDIGNASDDGGTAATGPATEGPGAGDDDDKGGCSCTTADGNGNGNGLDILAMLVAFVSLRLRRP